MILKNIYVLVANQERALHFYTKVLGLELYRKQDRYSILKIGDTWFGLLNEKYESNPRRGNNCIPVFKVSDLKSEFDRLKKLRVKFLSNIIELPDVKYFQFYDSEGNILEIYEER